MRVRALLAPLTPFYRFGIAMRERRLASGREPIRRLRLPVVSIGNLSTGGAGKTPLTIALARALAARGVAVDVLSRGYRRSGSDAASVNAAGSAEEFGDEPLLIARAAGVPVYVAAERYDAGMLAEAESSAAGSAVHILDDGFQHRQLYRDIDILLVNRADLNDRLLLAGNLREPLTAIRRAHVVAISADDPALESDLRARGWAGPVWRIRRRMEIPPPSGPVLAFCGIARPEQFFDGLEAGGLRVVACRAFRDHHRYTQSDLGGLAAQALSVGAAALMTTEKDAVRLEGLRAPMPIHTVALGSEIDEEQPALDWLLARIESLRRG